MNEASTSASDIRQPSTSSAAAVPVIRASSDSAQPHNSASGSGGGGGGGPLVVNSIRQKGNPVLNYIRSVRHVLGDCGADFECGPTCGILFLSLRYHRLHPDYIYSRLDGKAESRYRNKILLAMAGSAAGSSSAISLADEMRHALREINMAAWNAHWSLIVCYSVEEAAEYIENFQLAYLRGGDIASMPIRAPIAPQPSRANSSAAILSAAAQLQEKQRTHAIALLTSARGINKSDAIRLLACYGKLSNIARATRENLQIAGIGPVKAENLHKFLHQPFVVPPSNSKQSTVE